MSDGSNVSASSFFDKATDTLTTTVSPIAVVSAKYGTPKPAVPTSDPHETLRLIFDDSGDFISIEKHIVNDTNDWISDAEISETRKEQNVADRMLGDQPRSQNHPKTALDSVISYVVVDEHLLPESLEKFGKLQEYLGRQPKGKICYCDDVCAALNDCCRDYEAVCPGEYFKTAINFYGGQWDSNV